MGYYRVGFDGDEITNNDFSDGFSRTNTLGEISQARSKAGKRSKTKAGCSGNKKLIEVDYSIGTYASEYTWTVTKNIEYEGEKYTSIKPVLSGAYSSNDEGKEFHEEVSVPEGEYQFNIYVSDPPCTTSFQSILHAASLHASLCPDTSHTCNNLIVLALHICCIIT